MYPFLYGNRYAIIVLYTQWHVSTFKERNIYHVTQYSLLFGWVVND